MSLTSSLVFLCLCLSLGVAQIHVVNKCPEVQVDPEVTDCPPCLDCGFVPGMMCCPNVCGTESCTDVTKPCRENDVLYHHFDPMPYEEDLRNDKCGDCWCQNGHKDCVEYPCSGPVPLVVS